MMAGVGSSIVPAVTAMTFTTLAKAQAAIAALDAHFGFPAAAVNVASGRVVTPPPCTVTTSPIWAHPTLAKWAVIIQPSLMATYVQALAQAGIVAAATAALDSTWLGFTLAWPLAADIAAAQAKVGPSAMQSAKA